MHTGSVTTAAIIRFTEELEDKSTAFYEALAERWAEQKGTFQTFAQEGKKHKTWVVRTYQETISDALEAGFSFGGLNLQGYEVETALPEDASYAEALELAIGLEEKACAFYLDVAERSASLLATIPTAFKRVARRRNKRKLKLEKALAATVE